MGIMWNYSLISLCDSCVLAQAFYELLQQSEMGQEWARTGSAAAGSTMGLAQGQSSGLSLYSGQESSTAVFEGGDYSSAMSNAVDYSQQLQYTTASGAAMKSMNLEQLSYGSGAGNTGGAAATVDVTRGVLRGMPSVQRRTSGEQVGQSTSYVNVSGYGSAGDTNYGFLSRGVSGGSININAAPASGGAGMASGMSLGGSGAGNIAPGLTNTSINALSALSPVSDLSSYRDYVNQGSVHGQGHSYVQNQKVHNNYSHAGYGYGT